MSSPLCKMYELRFHPAVDKELESLHKDLRREIRNHHFQAISSNPREEGEILRGPLKGYWRRSLRWRGVEYRISYEIDEEEKVVYILMVRKREKFYSLLRRRVK